MSKEKGRKGLGLVDLVALSAGQVIGAGVVTLIGEAISVTGMSAWLAYGVAVIVGFFSIIPFIFLSSATVLKGGDYSVVSSMVKDRRLVGFFSTAFIVQCISLSMLGTSLGNYVASILPGVNSKLVAIAVVAIFYVTNLMGVDVMAKVQRVLTIILLITLGAFCIIGFTRVDFGTVLNISSPDFFQDGSAGFLNAISLYAYSTYGQYVVINYSKDARNPKRDIPLAIIITSAIIFVLYVCIAIVACGVLPISEVAGQPLTNVAREIFGSRFAVLFVVGGPIMALATTLNSTYGARVNVLSRITADGWFPKGLAKKNSRGVSYIILTIIFLAGIIPLMLGWSIKVITGNLVLVSYILKMITAMAVINMPNMCKEGWESSPFHIPNKAFYFIMVLVFMSDLYMIWITLRNLPLNIGIINVVFMACCFLYANVRIKGKKVELTAHV